MFYHRIMFLLVTCTSALLRAGFRTCTGMHLKRFWVYEISYTKNYDLWRPVFIVMPKIHFIIHFFLRYYILTNPVIWLADSILTHNSILNNNVSFHFRLFPRKTRDKIFQNIQKNILGDILGLFCLNLRKMKFPGKKSSVSF